MHTECAMCHTHLRNPDANCPSCGSDRAIDVLEFYRSEFDSVTRDVRLHVRSPRGTRSEAHTDCGNWTIDVSKARGIGRKSEPTVSEILCQTLAAQGLPAKHAPASDERGEDGKLIV